MDLQRKIEKLNSGMTVYSWLSKALDYPGEELIESLLNDELLRELNSKEAEEIEKYIDSFPNKKELLLELQKEYTRLCFVSKPRLVPLFESVYKEGKLYQDSTLDVARLYNEAGLKLGEEFKLPPDHITLELEFMSFLIYQEIEAINKGNKENEELALDLQKQTMMNHLGNFGMLFADKLSAHSKTPYFKSIAGILRIFMESEMEHYAN